MNKELNKLFNAFKIESNKSEDTSLEISPKGDRQLFRMREWQREAFEKLKDAPYMILSAPMGSGKSSMMCYLSAFRMYQDDQRRCIISVPQEVIGPGFVVLKHPLFEMPDGTVMQWGVGTNLCLPAYRKKDQFVKWLQAEGESQIDRILLCTHASLVSMFKQLKSSGQEGLLSNLLIWVDEAHHVMNALSEASNQVVSNGIGNLVHFFLTHPEMNINIGLTTATPIRGDRYTLLTPDMKAQFERYDLAFDRYLNSCRYLRSFSYNFMVCGRDYVSGIGEILRQEKARDFIYIPHTNSQHSLGDKHTETQGIVKEYEKIYGNVTSTGEQDLIVLNGPEGTFKILDLVDDDRKRRRSKKLYISKLKKDPESVNAIISMSMGKEGTDWECANRIIIVGSRGSLVDILQMLGRSLRDYPGKQHVKVIHLLPFGVKNESSNLRENLNDALKAILCSLLLEDVLKPIRIVDYDTLKEPTQNSEKSRSGGVLPLVELLPDPEQRIKVLQDLLIQYSELRAKCDSHEMQTSVLHAEFQNCVAEVLQGHQIEENAEQIGARAWKMIHERACPMTLTKGLDVESIKFDAINAVEPLDGLLVYLSQICGLNTFADLRRAIDASKMTLSEEEILFWVRQYIAEHKRKPTQKSGVVEFASGVHKGITWQDIDNSFKRGLRGLAGNDSLAAFIQRHTGEQSRKTSYHKIPIELARIWIKQYHNKYNDLPTKRTRIIEFASGDFQGTTWASLDSALRRGGRGLVKMAGGLTDLTDEVCGISNRKKIPVLPDEDILALIKAFMEKHGKKPHCNSGDVEGVKGLTWKNINEQLYRKGSSLSKFIQKNLGIRAKNIPHALTLSLVQGWIAEHVDKYKKPPAALSQVLVEFAQKTHPEITWGVVHSEIKKGRCELPKGSSLADVVKLTLEQYVVQ
jgi:superfamily II DNA or RNA helicase